MSGKSIISNSYLEDIGDAIRYKKGTEDTFYPSQMGDAIRSIEGIVPTGTMEIDANGVYDVTEKAEVDVDVNPDLRPLSVSENGQYSPDGFDGYSDVTVNNPAQWTTEGIADGSEPNGDIDLGNVTSIATYAFYGRPVTSVHGGSVQTVETHAFESCTSLVSATLPNATMGQSMFLHCTALADLHMARAGSVPTSALADTGLVTLYLPSLRTVGSYCVQSNANLETVIFPACTSLNANQVFANSAKLTKIVLGHTAVVPINANIFNGTPYANGGTGGNVYIPKSLYDHLGDGSNLDYLKNSAWNTLNSYGTITWHPIEGSEYETYMPNGAKYNEEMALT